MSDVLLEVNTWVMVCWHRMLCSLVDRYCWLLTKNTVTLEVATQAEARQIKLFIAKKSVFQLKHITQISHM